MAPEESVPLEEMWMKGGGGGEVRGEIEPPSKRTTLMYDYAIILIEPLHRSSLSVSSPQSQNSYHRQIFHFSPSVLLAFFGLYLFVLYPCEPCAVACLDQCFCAPLSTAAQVSSYSLVTPALVLLLGQRYRLLTLLPSSTLG